MLDSLILYNRHLSTGLRMECVCAVMHFYKTSKYFDLTEYLTQPIETIAVLTHTRSTTVLVEGKMSCFPSILFGAIEHVYVHRALTLFNAHY